MWYLFRGLGLPKFSVKSCFGLFCSGYSVFIHTNNVISTGAVPVPGKNFIFPGPGFTLSQK